MTSNRSQSATSVMNTTSSTIIGFAVFLLCVAIGGIFLRYLRGSYPNVWKELGEPGVLRNNDLTTQIKISRYLWFRRYRSLSNKRLVLLFDCMRVFQFVVLLSFAYFCVSTFLFLFGRFGQ